MTAGKRRPYLDQGLRLAQTLGISLDYLANDDLDEPPGVEFSADERALVSVYRAKGLDFEEAVRRLDVRSPAWNPGSVRDQSSLHDRKREGDVARPNKPKNKPKKTV
jgi:hypothetical protein